MPRIILVLALLILQIIFLFLFSVCGILWPWWCKFTKKQWCWNNKSSNATMIQISTWKSVCSYLWGCRTWDVTSEVVCSYNCTVIFVLQIIFVPVFILFSKNIFYILFSFYKYFNYLFPLLWTEIILILGLVYRNVNIHSVTWHTSTATFFLISED